jgi:hypothetical protein
MYIALLQVNKDKCKNKDSISRYKNTEKHAYLGSQPKLMKNKKKNNQIPEPNFLLSCEHAKTKWLYLCGRLMTSAKYYPHDRTLQ